jgi:hypothetical protein
MSLLNSLMVLRWYHSAYSRPRHYTMIGIEERTFLQNM